MKLLHTRTSKASTGSILDFTQILNNKKWTWKAQDRRVPNICDSVYTGSVEKMRVAQDVPSIYYTQCIVDTMVEKH